MKNDSLLQSGLLVGLQQSSVRQLKKTLNSAVRGGTIQDTLLGTTLTFRPRVTTSNIPRTVNLLSDFVSDANFLSLGDIQAHKATSPAAQRRSGLGGLTHHYADGGRASHFWPMPQFNMRTIFIELFCPATRRGRGERHFGDCEALITCLVMRKVRRFALDSEEDGSGRTPRSKRATRDENREETRAPAVR